MTNEELVSRIQQGHNDLLEDLYRQNRGLLWKEAQRYSWGGEMDDLMQVSYLGLHRAAMSYQPDQEANFCTYAIICIRSDLQKYTDRNTSVTISYGKQAEIRQLNKLTGELEVRTGRSATNQELCALMDCNLDELENIRAAAISRKPTSIDKPLLTDEGDEIDLLDTIPTEDNTAEALDAVENEELHDALMQELDTLPEREANAIKKKYFRGENFSSKQESRWHIVGMRRLRQPTHWKKLEHFVSYSSAIRGTGLREFKLTGSSATEREALHLVGF